MCIRPCPRLGFVVGVFAALFVACSRDRGEVVLLAPYDDGEKLGAVHATWDNTGEQRGFAGGDRLAEPEVRFRYRVDARNRGDDKVFLRLAAAELLDDSGLPLGRAGEQVECLLASGETRGILSGEIWIPASKVKGVRSLHVRHFAAPLGGRGVKRYREWLLQGRADDAARVDAEIAQQAGVQACAGR